MVRSETWKSAVFGFLHFHVDFEKKFHSEMTWIAPLNTMVVPPREYGMVVPLDEMREKTIIESKPV